MRTWNRCVRTDRSRARHCWAAAGLGLLLAGVVPVGQAKDRAAALPPDPELQQLQSDLEARERETLDLKRRMADVKRRQAETSKSAVDVNATQFSLPRLRTAPKIDGVIDAAEWAGAVGVPLTTRGSGASIRKRPSSVFFLGWDEEYLYGAQQLPLREGERLLRLNREPKRDKVDPHENAMEFYVDRKSHGSHGSACRWQFMGNASGNRFEREDQYEIGQNFVDWDGEWQYAQRLAPDGKSWDVEFAIPRKTVYQEHPLRDGDVWWIGMATDLHRPWTWSGFYGYSIPATFREGVPEIRLRHPERSQTVRGIGFDLSVSNGTPTAFEGRLVYRLLTSGKGATKDGVVFEKERALRLAPGEAASFEVNDPVDPAIGAGRVAIVVERGGTSLYTWSEAIDYNDPEADMGVAYTPDRAAFGLNAAYNPLSNYVRVEVDKYDFARAEAVAKARCTVSAPGGRVLASGEVTRFEYGKGDVRVATPADLAAGSYDCTVELLDASGASLARETASFIRKDHAKEYPWLGNAIGEQDEVLPPFEPLAVAGDTVKGFRKEIVMGGAAMPARITAAGVELLRGPVALEGEADGKPFAVAPTAMKPTLVVGSPTRARYRGAAAGGPVSAEVEAEWEYDGTCKLTLDLKPAGRGAVRLDALRLVIPFTAEGGVSYMANGLNMRLSNQTGLIPKPGARERLAGTGNWLPGAPAQGPVWTSTSVQKQKMTVGSFVPFVWIGNLRSGLTWFADNDQGWWPSAKKGAIEIERDAPGCANLVLNLASEPVSFDGPRRIVFGLNVNPVRPDSEHKRSRYTFGFTKETGRWDGKTMPNKFAKRYPDNPELNRQVIERVHRLNGIFAPYTEMSWADFEPDVAEYFREEWNRFGLGGPVFCKTSNDYLIWLFDRWVADCGVDGLYFDNVYNKLNYNTHAGTAYRLPDGRIQPGYDLWGMRENIKRTRAVLVKRKNGAPFRILIHNTRNQFAPIMGFADCAMGGEMPTPRGDLSGKPDWIDMHPREFMTVQYNEPLWGYKLSHLYHFASETYVDEFGQPDEAAALKVHRGAMATMLVNGVEFFQGRKENLLQSRFQLLKQASGGTLRFMPGWDAEGLFRLDPADPDLDVGVWCGTDHLLVVVCNWSKKPKTAKVWLDFPKLLRRPAPMGERIVWDFETLERFDANRGDGRLTDREFPATVLPRLDEGADTTINIPNTIQIKVEPHDFRAALIGNVPLGGTGAGF